MHIGEPSEIAFADDSRGEARLGEDYHTRRRLNQMSASAGPHDEKEGVLDFAVKPNDSCKAAKHFTLATLTQNGLAGATSRLNVRSRIHRAAPQISAPGLTGACGICSQRAARSFKINWVALRT